MIVYMVVYSTSGQYSVSVSQDTEYAYRVFAAYLECGISVTAEKYEMRYL